MAKGFRHFPSYPPSAAKTSRRCTRPRVLQHGHEWTTIYEYIAKIWTGMERHIWTYWQNMNVDRNVPPYMDWWTAGLFFSTVEQCRFCGSLSPLNRPAKTSTLNWWTKKGTKSENDRRTGYRGADEDKTWLFFATPSAESRNKTRRRGFLARTQELNTNFLFMTNILIRMTS